MYLKLGFNPCKAEQPLQTMELQEKEKDEKHLRKRFRKNQTITGVPTVAYCAYSS